MTQEIGEEEKLKKSGNSNSLDLADLGLDLNENLKAEDDEVLVRGLMENWADEVDFQSSAQKHWAKLNEGQRINVSEQAQEWNSVVVCMVMGVNPPFSMFEEFVKRIWGYLGIEQVVRMNQGLTIVKFKDKATRDLVLESGTVQFDKKPMIVRPWTQDLDTVSTIGKPIMVDKVTKERSMIRVKFKSSLLSTNGFPSSVTTAKDMAITWRSARKLVRSSQLVVFVTFVYGLNTIEERVELWKELSNITCHGAPWLIVCDFNGAFFYDDRTGSRAVSANDLMDSTTWLAQTKVEALNCIGLKFTWSNKQDGKGRVYSKIDHAFTNEDWIDKIPNSMAVFRWETSSDHCYCVVKTQQQESLGIKPFQKLMRLKHALKTFNKEEIFEVEQNYHQAKADNQCALTNAQATPTEEMAQLKEKVVVATFQQQAAMYQSFLVQRSKITWLSKGDDNNAFFHACTKKRRQENRIVSFINEDGEMVDGYNKVVQYFVSHFKNYIGSNSSISQQFDAKCMEMGPCLSVELQLSLIKKFTKEDVKKALFSIARTKSPGVDGYNFKFYKVMWSLISDEIAEAILNFFDAGRMPEEFNEAVIALMPKVEMPCKAVDYRPIRAGAFVKGRSLAHNILIFQDLIKNYSRENVSPRCALKIDLSKAYDTLDWSFLEELLKSYRFPTKFIHWIMVCLRDTSCVLMMNGWLQKSFKGAKGLIQGDPISPMLFVLVMEYLTRMLQYGANEKKFRYHPQCKNLKIINLCFADDLIIFCKANKGSVFFGGISRMDKAALLKILQIEEGDFPLKYLGITMRPTNWKAKDCGVILKRIKNQLHTWASRHLSYAGRCQVINSVLLGLRNYWMNIFLLPQRTIKEIDKLCMWFLWGNNATRSKFHLTSWANVYLPKE
uniref:Reverse transcriptase domain-containing protein n=1 Tax=Cannabis sativa TaxID=3483 RepID=A0A803PLV2_CANSA